MCRWTSSFEPVLMAQLGMIDIRLHRLLWPRSICLTAPAGLALALVLH